MRIFVVNKSTFDYDVEEFDTIKAFTDFEKAENFAEVLNATGSHNQFFKVESVDLVD